MLKGQATAGTLEVTRSAGALSITGADNIARFRVLTMRSALALECKGLKHSRGSVYALVKREFGFKGNRERVLEQLDAFIAANIRKPGE